MKKKRDKKNYAFIDSQNVYLGIRFLGWKLNFKRFRIYLKDKYKVSKAFLFIGYVIGNELLYASLQEAGFIVIFKPTLQFEKRGGTFIKGNVDADLVLHTMIEYPNYDKAIIVTGDGDFYCLLEYLEDTGKLFKLMIPNRRKYSRLLWKFRKYIVYMNELRGKL